MNKFSSIFGQILQIFSKNEFYKAVMETGAERGAKGFTCWQRFVAMLFCQIGQVHSLMEMTGWLAEKSDRKRLTKDRKPSKNIMRYCGSLLTGLICVLTIKTQTLRFELQSQAE